jgi:hypothetical protein
MGFNFSNPRSNKANRSARRVVIFHATAQEVVRAKREVLRPIWQHIQHQRYNELDIRSGPVEVRTEKRGGWKLRIHVTFPTGDRTMMIEYFDHNNIST